MIILFIFGLLLGGVSVIFALENTAIVTVTLFHSQVTGSLAFILIGAMCTGVLVTVLLLLPESVSNYFKYRNLAKKIENLEEELRKQKTITSFARTTHPTPEIIEKIDKGAISTKEGHQN